MAYKRSDITRMQDQENEKEETYPDYEEMYSELNKKYNRSLSTIESYQEENKSLQNEIDELNSKLEYSEIQRMELLNRCDELEKQLEKMESLPFDPLQCADYLINATYKDETNGIERAFYNLPEEVDKDKYTIDELEQIAEHLLIYCKHNKGCEE